MQLTYVVESLADCRLASSAKDAASSSAALPPAGPSAAAAAAQTEAFGDCALEQAHAQAHAQAQAAAYSLDPAAALDSLACPLCFHIPNRAKRLPCCSYIICAPCARSWLHQHSSCPFCRSPVAPPLARHGLPDAADVQAVLDRLDVLCPYSDNGCPWIGLRSAVLAHIRSACIIAIDPDTGARAVGAVHPDDFCLEESWVSPALAQQQQQQQQQQQGQSQQQWQQHRSQRQASLGIVPPWRSSDTPLSRTRPFDGTGGGQQNTTLGPTIGSRHTDPERQSLLEHANSNNNNNNRSNSSHSRDASTESDPPLSTSITRSITGLTDFVRRHLRLPPGLSASSSSADQPRVFPSSFPQRLPFFPTPVHTLSPLIRRVPRAAAEAALTLNRAARAGQGALSLTLEVCALILRVSMARPTCPAMPAALLPNDLCRDLRPARPLALALAPALHRLPMPLSVADWLVTPTHTVLPSSSSAPSLAPALASPADSTLAARIRHIIRRGWRVAVFLALFTATVVLAVMAVYSRRF
ncbi:hypothetical protein BC831DRAFT_448253 [Entophlyctis helioformis]|nr:hypothetical protein BC831DRAFT_448253 [Entophlyctis helioformis]